MNDCVNYMLNGVNVLCHNSIRIEKNGLVIYIDPYNVSKEYSLNDADIIFITHSHYDHFSIEDILKVCKADTKYVCTYDVKEGLDSISGNGSESDESNNVYMVKPYDSFELLGINVSTVPAYNVNKEFHKKEYNWVGYVLEIDKFKYYIAGDTDITEENKKVNCDICFVPAGGTYTMNYEEAALLCNTIKPKVAIPTHYGLITGDKDDGKNFKKSLDCDIICKIFI